VVAVNYSGIATSPYYCTAKRRFPRGALASREQCFVFQDALKLVRRAPNINENKTLVLHPASTICCGYTMEEKFAMGVSESMLRLAVGIEDVEDIIEHLERGLAAL
jgi:O-acetylhomoserine (thiol)-lyase